MKENEGSRLDLLVDLLADEVAERLGGRISVAELGVDSATTDRCGGEPEGVEEQEPSVDSPGHLEPSSRLLPPRPTAVLSDDPEKNARRVVGSEAGAEELLPDPPGAPAEPPLSSLGPAHTARLLGRLALGMLVLLVIINVPFNRHGTTLATAMSDARALVFRDGLVVKEEDDPEIYVFQDNEFRWISSLDAFQRLGYTWADVHVVEDGFLDDYAIGAPIHVLLKCPDSPHIYRLEAEEKRWVVDIAAFEAEGHVWEDVRSVSCAHLRQLPDGETIPPGHGPPPQP